MSSSILESTVIDQLFDISVSLCKTPAKETTAACADVFDCPASYTLTSAGCSSWCTSTTVPSDSCIYYPTSGAVPCADTSVGYCAKTPSASCTVKCLSTSFFVDDSASLPDGSKGKALGLGLRGSTGSFGRSEPIETIQDLALATVTKLSIKDFMLTGAAAPLHRITMLPSSATSTKTSVLQTLELINVHLAFPQAASGHTLPPTLKKLVVNNNALSLPASSSFRQDVNASNATATSFPVDIFQLPSLEHLDLRGNPSLYASSFSTQQLAFFRQLAFFAADFNLQPSSS